MRRNALLLLAGLLSASTALAQSPFDMTKERPPQAEPPAAAPGATPPETNVDAAPAPVPPAGPFRRYLLPASDFVLAGEAAQRSWTFYLTPEQAASAETLNIGYQNAIVVAPEASRLKLSVNGAFLVDIPIASADDVTPISVPVPGRLLRAGSNDIRIEAVQRHRTDCTIESTYELWTSIDPAKTFLTFGDAQAATWKRVEDLRAVGVDAAGETSFNLIVPALGQSVATESVLRMVQGTALMAEMPNQAVTVAATGQPVAGAGAATIVMGTASELRPVLASLPDGADAHPVSGIVDDPKLGHSVIVVSGPTWQDIANAVTTIVSPVDRQVSVLRKTVQTSAWRIPDAPMVFGETRLRLSELGVPTQEFSGRRFRTDFVVGVPSDFYANDYGEATLLLDAAYSADVGPGSHIDIYVNGNIAATVPVTTGGGEILRHLPIKVTMRHFQPGVNTIAIEAVLLTEADRVCLPGATALDAGRFVIFDTSEFAMPDFARIGQLPNLAALGGTGFPYGRSEARVPILLDGAGAPTLSAAATLLARMATAAGRLIPLDLDVSPASVGDRDAIFVGAISQVPPALLSRVGVAEASRSSWSVTVTEGVPDKPDTARTFDQWRERLRDSGWRGQVSALQEWLSRTFDVSLDTFRLRPAADAEFLPSGNATLLVAQRASPSGDGTWTVVTAPTSQALESGVKSLTASENWFRMGGHITTFGAADNLVTPIRSNDVAFMPTQPGSFTNYRLIIANWLSQNALSYSLLLTAFSIMLGLATAAMLSRLGRKR